MANGRRFVLLGRQGAGKGTQCTRLRDHFGLVHVSTGDVFRAAVRDGTRLGRRVGAYLDRGELVPDDLVIEAVAERLSQPEVRRRGFLLDGVPRTVAQAAALFQALDDQRPIDAAIDLDVPTEVVVLRLAARRVCDDCGAIATAAVPTDESVPCAGCGGLARRRSDDTDAAIRRRLAIYDDQSGPLTAWFDQRRLLVRVDGSGSPDEVFARILAAIEPAPAATPVSA